MQRKQCLKRKRKKISHKKTFDVVVVVKIIYFFCQIQEKDWMISSMDIPKECRQYHEQKVKQTEAKRLDE